MPTATAFSPLRPVPEGVASPDGRWLYLPAASGGLDAVAAASGELRWHQAGAALALLAEDAQVLVLEPTGQGRLRPRWLDAADGTPRQQRTGVLPPPLPHLAGGPGAWAITDSVWHDDRLLLAWSARAYGGRAPVAHGVLALDPAQLAQTAEDASWPPPPDWPGGIELLPFAEGGTPLPPWTVQGEVVALALREPPAGQRALLLLRCGGGPPGAAVLVEPLPPPGCLQPLASPDPGLVTLLHTAHPADAGTGPVWRLFTAPDGAPLATLAAEDGLLPPFCRCGELLLVRRLGALAHKRASPPRQLCAWQVGDGRPLWQRPLPPHSPQRLTP